MERAGARLAATLRQAFDAMVDEVVEGLAAQGHPHVTATLELALVAIDDGAADASTLARSLGVSRQAAAKTIRTLESLGYLERASDPADARRRPLRVTAHGREMMAIGAALFDDIHSRWELAIGSTAAADAERAIAALAAPTPAD